jgi:ribosomal protein S10
MEVKKHFMKQYCLKIQSKNEKSLKNVLHFFFTHLKIKFRTIQKSSSTITKRKTVTFLKSPHVNKTAQEHFEYKIFTRKVLLKGFYLEKNLIFLKKVLAKLFQDISIHIEFITSKTMRSNNNLSIFSFDNSKFLKKRSFRTNFKRHKQKTLFKVSGNKKSSLFYLVKLLTKTSLFGETLLVYSLKNNKLSE